MINTSRCREKTEGWLGRRREYQCHECHARFQVDTLNPLPKIDRVCPDCRRRTQVYIFTDKRTGKDKQVRASNTELATLRAWNINRNLTFKIPQPTEIYSETLIH